MNRDDPDYAYDRWRDGDRPFLVPRVVPIPPPIAAAEEARPRPLVEDIETRRARMRERRETLMQGLRSAAGLQLFNDTRRR